MLCLWVTKRVPPRLVVALLATTTFALCWVDGGSRAPLSTAGFCAPGSHFIDRTARRDADSDRRYKRDLAVLRRRKHAWCCSSETTRGVEADDDDAENPKDTLVGGVVSREASQRKLEALEAWLDDIGVDRGGSCGSDGENRPSVKLKRFPLGGIGLECTRELERDSTVASIPRRVCLSSDPSDAPCGTLRAWAHSVLASTPPPRCDRDGRKQIEVEEDVASVTLQLFLEHAAGERSAFAPWVTMLPLDNDDELNLPALWPADDRAALRGTVVLRDTEECLTRAMVERNWVANALARRLERTQEGGEMSTMAGEGEAEGVIREWCNPSSGEDMRRRPGLEEWLRVRCAVQSRAYRVGGRYVLIPLVDFANHDDGVAYAVSQGDGVFTGTDEVVLSTDRAYQLGEQVCTTYGDMDIAKRLFSFGFVTLTPHGNNTPSEATRQSSTVVKGCTTTERCTIGERSATSEGSTGVPPSTCVDQSFKWCDCPSISDGRLSLPTEAYCDVELPVLSDDPLRSLKMKVLKEFSNKSGDDNMGNLSAVFRLDRISHRPLFMKHLIDEYAWPFMESALPLLRLATLTPEDMLGDNLVDFSPFGGLSHKHPPDDECCTAGSRGVSQDCDAQGSVAKSSEFSGRKHADVGTPPGIGTVSRFEDENEAMMPARLLVRLKRPVSSHNERRALRFLEVQCSDRLRAIGLDASDVRALVEVSGEVELGGGGLNPNGGYETFAVTRPRSVLCATVRVAEAIAWGSLLFTCGRGGSVCTGSAADFSLLKGQPTLRGWLQQLCNYKTSVCG